MKKITLILLASLSFILVAQESIQDVYNFEVVKQNEALPVQSQGNTGTCWSFATASFLESELMRMGHKNIDLSEMFIVKQVYKEKAENYVRFHGKTNIGQGSLTHDYLNAAETYGLVPHEAFHPEKHVSYEHNHKELFSVLKAMLTSFVKNDVLSKHWKSAYNAILDIYLGEDVEEFKVGKKTYTPASYKTHLDFHADDYIHLSSYTHHPFNQEFILEVPDNWSNGFVQNIELDELTKTAISAVKKGYTISWDADVSNSGFSAKHGLAIQSEVNLKKAKDITECIEEQEITQESRQEHFDDFRVTDDHLMHITGLAKDKNGKLYFIVKNSWGTKKLGLEGFEGHIFVSEAYFRLNTISITLHKSAL
ncbi:MAG: C1 family peptidase [Flavobacteriales bacterium]